MINSGLETTVEMNWRELESWAERNRMRAEVAGYHNGLRARLVYRQEVLVCSSVFDERHSAKRALCRAVARILESER